MSGDPFITLFQTLMTYDFERKIEKREIKLLF